MSNNQTKDLDKIPAVKELNDETAANVQGGYDLNVYRHNNLVDWLGGFNFGTKQLSSNANNQISSVKISAGRWRFYDLSNWRHIPFRHDYINLGVGSWNLPGFNDKISSIQRY